MINCKSLGLIINRKYSKPQISKPQNSRDACSIFQECCFNTLPCPCSFAYSVLYWRAFKWGILWYLISRSIKTTITWRFRLPILLNEKGFLGSFTFCNVPSGRMSYRDAHIFWPSTPFFKFWVKFSSYRSFERCIKPFLRSTCPNIVGC